MATCQAAKTVRRVMRRRRRFTEAEKQIGMVVEGAYTCIAAKELAQQRKISMPITEAVFDMLAGSLSATEAVTRLMQRDIKEERL